MKPNYGRFTFTAFPVVVLLSGTRSYFGRFALVFNVDYNKTTGTALEVEIEKLLPLEGCFLLDFRRRKNVSLVEATEVLCNNLLATIHDAVTTVIAPDKNVKLVVNYENRQVGNIITYSVTLPLV